MKESVQMMQMVNFLVESEYLGSGGVEEEGVCVCVHWDIVVNYDMTVLHCMVIVTLTIFININQAEKI